MTTEFKVRSSPPDEPDAPTPSLSELRIGCPGRVALMIGDEERVVLDDAPLIGVRFDLAECLLRLGEGARNTEVVGFYDDYRFVLHESAGVVECEDAYRGGRCSAGSAAFHATVRDWGDRWLAAIEARDAGVLQNQACLQLKSCLAETWGAQVSGG